MEGGTTVGAADLTSIQTIFTDAATQLGGMLVPIMTAGVVIVIGIAAFQLGKRLFNKSTK